MNNDWLAGFAAPLDAFGGGALALPAVLDALLAKTSSATNAPVRAPVVTLALSTGRELTGHLLAQSSREPKTYTLAVAAGREPRLAFVLASSIVGVVVEDVGDVGKPLPSVELVGKLELARRARAIGEKHGARCEIDVDGGDDGARLTIQLLLAKLDEALAAIRRDGAGKDALRAIDSIVLRCSDAGVQRDGRVLVVAARGAERIPASLEGAISAVL